MKLYKVTAGEHARYVGSQAEAAAHRRVLNQLQKIPRDKIQTEEVDIPVDKKGLLSWLNEFAA